MRRDAEIAPYQFSGFAPGEGTPPTISSFPESSITLEEESNLTLRAVAEGSSPLEYQWYLGDSPITGATTAELNLTSLQATDAGVYRLVVTNSVGTATAEVQLVVRSALGLRPMYRDAQLRFWITANGEPGRAFRVESSPDLVHWTPLGTLTNVTGSTLFGLSTPDSQSRCFYRAAVLDGP